MTRRLSFDANRRNVLRKFRWRNFRYTNDIAGAVYGDVLVSMDVACGLRTDGL